MKTIRTAVLVFLLVLVLLIFKAGCFGDRMSSVEAFRGGQLETAVFDPLIAGNVNRAGLLHLTIDGESYDNQGAEIMVNQKMQVSVSLPFIRDVFSASARSYPDGSVLIERNTDTLELKQDSLQGEINGKEIDLTEAPETYDGKCYLGLEDLCRVFGYGYSWDEASVTAALDSSAAEAPKLRRSYDLRDRDRVSEIRDQGTMSSCWAYAAISALESSLLPSDPVKLSPNDLADRNTYGRKADQAGNYMMAVSDMVSWQGPVQERGTGTALHVQEVHFYTEDDIDDIKWAVFKNGGVSTSLYAEVNSSDLSESSWYNSRTDAYCYKGSKEPNHDVVIIGWDDGYDKDNFSLDVPGNGAFICQNSWGSDFGDKGVFYVSYYDTNVGSSGVAYAKAERVDNYDRIYQTDLLGMIGTIGYGADSCMAANVYTARSDETLRAAGFYTTGKNTEYRVYTVDDFEGADDLADRKPQASGLLKDKGYYTIPFSDPVTVTQGRRFAVVVMLKTPGSDHPIGIEYDGNELTDKADLTDGEGYISRNGLEWDRSESKYHANVCLKAYTSLTGPVQADPDHED